MSRNKEEEAVFRTLDKPRNTGVVLIFSLITLVFIVALIVSLRTHEPMLALP